MPPGKKQLSKIENMAKTEETRRKNLEKLEEENATLKAEVKAYQETGSELVGVSVENNKEIDKLKKQVKKLKDSNKNLEDVATDDLEMTIQYRESKGIYKMVETAAKAEGLSPSKWARKLVRARLGLGG